MPNTKSAERRMRNSARKAAQNSSVKSRLHTLERKFKDAVSGGKPEEAAAALKNVISAADKAAKTGVIPKSTADRKKSRLTVALNKAAKPAVK